MSRRAVRWSLSLVLALWTASAHAQRVIVLPVAGDRSHLRDQIQDALKHGGHVEALPLKTYRAALAQAKVRAADEASPESVAEVSEALGLDAALAGSVSGNSFAARILDPRGEELWSRKLPLVRGRLSADNARRLASAIAAAAKPREQRDATAPPPPHGDESPPPPPPSDDLRVRTMGRTPLDGSRPAENVESEPPTEPEGEVEGDARPKIISVYLMGGATWRTYCSRPGVPSCKAYNDLPDADKPTGQTVQLDTVIPYASAGVDVEIFPFTSSDSFLRGVGLAGSYSRGSALTRVQVSTPAGDIPGIDVSAVDQVLTTSLLLRYYFSFGHDELPGYLGLHGGALWRQFDVDPKAGIALPGTRRLFPAGGLGVGLPFFKWLSVEASGSYFLNPAAGPGERQAYGDPATAFGFGLDGGFSGDLWGPIGYFARVHLELYWDSFTGPGTRWTQGGIAQELYATANVGLGARF